MKTLGTVAVTVLLAILALASSAVAEPGVTDTEILIGSCSALDGPANFLGQQTVLGALCELPYALPADAQTPGDLAACDEVLRFLALPGHLDPPSA